MKMHFRFCLAAALAVMVSAGAASGAEPTLKVGDAAPRLQVGKWLQGDPVKEFERGKAYMVEFWATWCGPCIASIPHVNELQQKFKDKGFIVIGQNVSEPDESAVEPFIKKMGEKMTYRVALDDKSKDPNGAMSVTWMAASGQQGIPAAFIVDTEGKIAWIGHPMMLQERTLEEILSGRYDSAKAAAEAAQLEEAQPQIRQLTQKLSANLRQSDWDAADATVGEIERLLPASQRDGVAMVRFQISLEREDYDEAYRIARSVSDKHPDNAMLQNVLARAIATRPGIARRDLDLAETMAVRASEAAAGKDPNALETLARVQFMKGKKDEALATAEKAVQAADESTRARFEQLLASYREGKLPDAN